jgi:hypothetical protein
MLSPAQHTALAELCEGSPFFRLRGSRFDGWKTPSGRFVPLIVIANLRKAGFVAVDHTTHTCSVTPAGRKAFAQ